MSVRTLVIGIPLPDASFDNHSFASAPSISEYTRLIVETESISRVVEEIMEGDREHTTFAGQTVSNGPSTTRTFGLAELIAMRTREAVLFFRAGGVALCIAHPDAVHYGIHGMAEWRRYGWLPTPEECEYGRDLLPAFGKGGTTVTDPSHSFAEYVARFGSRMAYRVTIPGELEKTVRVFARSTGGEAAGFEMPMLAGSIVFVPPLAGEAEDRIEIAGTLFQCFGRLPAAIPRQPSEWIRKQAG